MRGLIVYTIYCAHDPSFHPNGLTVYTICLCSNSFIVYKIYRKYYPTCAQIVSSCKRSIVDPSLRPNGLIVYTIYRAYDPSLRPNGLIVYTILLTPKRSYRINDP